MKEKVRKKFPNSCCVRTTGRGDKTVNETHYRIWPTGNPFETRVIGIGNTEEEAWENAFERIP